MEKTTKKENFLVLKWSINSFSCWHMEIHDKVIESPQSNTTPAFWMELYPKGLSGNYEHLVVHVRFSQPKIYHGDLSFISSDGTLLLRQNVNSKKISTVVELSPGPKFEEVVAQIRKKEPFHGDQLTLQLRIRNLNDFTHNVHTEIDVLPVSFKMHSDILDCLHLSDKRIILLKFPLDEEEMGQTVFLASKDNIYKSKVVLKLQKDPHKKPISVLTRMSVLSNGDVKRTEENEHLFQDGIPWEFSNSLTSEEVVKEGFSLILYLKIIACKKHKQSFTLLQLHPIEIDILQTNSKGPYGTGASKYQFLDILSTVTSHKPDSSVAVLTNELMCLYQDQDFSDFQLQCGTVSFPVHKNILSARSPVFKTMFSTDMKEAASGAVDIVDLDTSTLARFLAFLYTGTVEDLQGESALKLYFAADKYQVPSLKRECVDFLSSNVSISNVCDILSFGDKHQDNVLSGVAHDFFLKNYNEILGSEEWDRFMGIEPLLALKTLSHFGAKKYVVRKGSS